MEVDQGTEAGEVEKDGESGKMGTDGGPKGSKGKARETEEEVVARAEEEEREARMIKVAREEQRVKVSNNVGSLGKKRAVRPTPKSAVMVEDSDDNMEGSEVKGAAEPRGRKRVSAHGAEDGPGPVSRKRARTIGEKSTGGPAGLTRPPTTSEVSAAAAHRIIKTITVTPGSIKPEVMDPPSVPPASTISPTSTVWIEPRAKMTGGLTRASDFGLAPVS